MNIFFIVYVDHLVGYLPPTELYGFGVNKRIIAKYRSVSKFISLSCEYKSLQAITRYTLALFVYVTVMCMVFVHVLNVMSSFIHRKLIKGNPSIFKNVHRIEQYIQDNTQLNRNTNENLSATYSCLSLTRLFTAGK